MTDADDSPSPPAPSSAAGAVEVRVLGPLRVVLDRREVAAGDWPTRRAQELVALLALAPGHRLARDRVLEELWPHLDGHAAAANLRKAAHHARKTLGTAAAVVLRAGTVELFADRRVRTDLELFLAAAEEALSAGDPAACARVVATCHDELLPDAPYESWTQEPRRRVQARLAELVRASGDVERLLEVEPTDEAACRAVMSAAIEAGRRHAAIRAYERLRLALARELGAAPGAQTRALYARCTSGVRLGETSFVGRELELAAATAELRRVEGGGTAAIAVRGTIGMGKSAFCRELLHRAAGEGWRVLTVAATTSGVPYAPLSAMLEQVLTGSHGAVAGLRGRTRSVLGELTPLVKAGAPLSGPMTRHQVIAAVRRSLTLTDPAPPTLVCLEDAHLADEASADVLRQLVAAGAGCPFALVVAVRSEWVRTSLPRGIDELVRSAQTQLLRLPPMRSRSSSGSSPLCAPQSAPAAAAEIARSGGGQSVLRPRARGRAAMTAAERCRDRARGDPRALPRPRPGTIDRSRELAVAARELDLATVLALTGWTSRQPSRCSTRPSRRASSCVSGTRYRFRHELVRQAFVDALAPHRRARSAPRRRRPARRRRRARRARRRHFLAGGGLRGGPLAARRSRPSRRPRGVRRRTRPGRAAAGGRRRSIATGCGCGPRCWMPSAMGAHPMRTGTRRRPSESPRRKSSRHGVRSPS